MQRNTLGLVHEFLRRHVKEGDFCIDATAGRGRDTALLYRLTGERGTVLAFDIQREAVEETRALLEREGLSARVVQDSHANMERYAQPESVDCVVFNFGRLPGGNPAIFTLADSSVAAIDAGLRLLRPGGVMAIALYYGKENGYEERDAVLAHLASIDARAYTVLCCQWSNRRGEPPMPIFIWKESGTAETEKTAGALSETRFTNA